MRSAAFLLLAAAAAAQGRSVEAEIAAGRDAFEARKYDEAVSCFARVRLLAPHDWRGHGYQALALVQQAMGEGGVRRADLLREAERVAGELVKLGLADFHDPFYRFVKGLVHQVKGEQAKALATFEEALRAPPEKFLRYGEIGLHQQIRRTAAICGTRVAGLLLAAGRAEAAEIELAKADAALPPDDPERRRLERMYAAAAENLGKAEKAVEHLRRCIELSRDDPAAVDELTGTIALIHVNHDETEKGRAVLAEARTESRQPELVLARCTLAVRDAMREGGPRLDDALKLLRDAMRTHPQDQVYWLVLLYRDIVLTKVGMREAQTPEGQALLKEAIAILEDEIERRPECPPLYFALYRIHKLLGDGEQERRYQDLHEKKKREFESSEKFDPLGRPRCGN